MAQPTKQTDSVVVALHDLPTAPLSPLAARGRAILLATADSLPDHVGNVLRCTSCHLDEGRRPWAAPWTGIANRYPQLRSRSGVPVSLVERVNGCFERSMNGTALDSTSDAMQAMLAYFAWRSAELDPDAPITGVGLPPVTPVAADHPDAGDPVRGETVYAAECARCHGVDGDGTPLAPPVWGPRSYNIGAGMARRSKAAGFIGANMPYDRPGSLSIEDARDAAAYINAQTRPDFARKAFDWPRGDAPADAAYETNAQRRLPRASQPMRVMDSATPRM